MKKKMLLLSLATVVLLSTGCGSKKELHCTLKQGEGAVTTSTMDVTFKGNEAQDVTLSMSIDYTDEYASYADTFKQTLETQKSTLEKVGYKVEITSEKNSQKLKATGTADTLDESESKGSYEATKENLEKSGYTCK